MESINPISIITANIAYLADIVTPIIRKVIDGTMIIKNAMYVDIPRTVVIMNRPPTR